MCFQIHNVVAIPKSLKGTLFHMKPTDLFVPFCKVLEDYFKIGAFYVRSRDSLEKSEDMAALTPQLAS